MAMLDVPGVLRGRRWSVRVERVRFEVVFRNIPARAHVGLWNYSSRSYRWSVGAPTLYASTDAVVCLAERVKQTLARPLQVELGYAEIDLQLGANLAAAGALPVQLPDVLSADYVVPQRIGMMLHKVGISALVVPAAIGEVAALFPRIEVTNTTSTLTGVHEIPSSGTNVVVFRDRLAAQDRITFDVRPRERLIIRGLRK